MQRVDIVIPSFWVPLELIRNKLNPFLETTPEETEIFVYAYCPLPEKNYISRNDELVDVEVEYEKSVERWLLQLGELIDARVDKEHYVVVSDKDIARRWRANKGKANTSLLILLLGEKTMLPLYRSIIRGTDVPILALFEKSWKPPIQVVAAVDPFHDRDEDNQRDVRIVTKCKEMSKILQGTVSMFHCYQIPVYLAEYKRRVREYRRESIKQFAEDNKFFSLDSIVINGVPATEIRKYVKDNEVDLLGIGSVSRGFLEKYVMGSTADALLSSPPCDLLLLRS